MIGSDYFSDAPQNEGNYVYCDRCDDFLDHTEQADPIMVNGLPVCDKCADQLATLAINQKIWEQEYDKLPGRVKHI